MSSQRNRLTSEEPHPSAYIQPTVLAERGPTTRLDDHHGTSPCSERRITGDGGWAPELRRNVVPLAESSRGRVGGNG